jgi:hypothetical protein
MTTFGAQNLWGSTGKFMLGATGKRRLRSGVSGCCCGGDPRACPEDCSSLASSYLVTPSAVFSCSHCTDMQPPALVASSIGGCGWANTSCPSVSPLASTCDFCATFHRYRPEVLLQCDLGYWSICYVVGEPGVLAGANIIFRYFKAATAGSSPVGTYEPGDPVGGGNAVHCTPFGQCTGTDACPHYFDIDPGDCVVS